MPKIHFFKAKSRIGLTNKPIRQDSWNYGVENGFEAILTRQFFAGFPNIQVDEFTFPNPEDISNKDYINVLAANLEKFKNLINQKLKPGKTQVVVGGENSVTFSSLLAMLERVKDVSRVGYIQFDSHGEMNSFHGSISHNFHGMYLRPFFDKFDLPEIARLVPFRLKPQQAILIGDMVLDGDEPEFFNKQKFRNITRRDYLEQSSEIQGEVALFCKQFEFIHINFDIDVFDRSVAGATGIPEDGRWMWGEVLAILEIISKHQKLSLDLSEINPKKAGAKRTIKVAQQVLKTLLG